MPIDVSVRRVGDRDRSTTRAATATTLGDWVPATRETRIDRGRNGSHRPLSPTCRTASSP